MPDLFDGSHDCKDDDEFPIDASSKPTDALTDLRLARQEMEMLRLFLPGDEVSNVQLSKISLKYFSKLTTLRGHGFVIGKVREDSTTGVAWYRLPSPIPLLRTYEVPVEVRVPGSDPVRRIFRVEAVSATSARYRAWRQVKVIALGKPVEIPPAPVPT